MHHYTGNFWQENGAASFCLLALTLFLQVLAKQAYPPPKKQYYFKSKHTLFNSEILTPNALL